EIYTNLKSRICDKFCVKSEIRNVSSGSSVLFSDLAQEGDDDSILMLLYGRYNWTNVGGTHRLDARTGGHFVTMSVLVSSDAGTRYVAVRDPADPRTDTVQEAFTNRFWDFDTRTVFANYLTGGAGPAMLAEEMFNGTPSSSGGTMRMLDGYISITPRNCYSWDEYDDGVRVLTPTGPVWSGSLPEELLEFGPQIIDVVPGPWGRNIYIRTSEGKILCYRLVDTDIIEIMPPDLKSPIAGIAVDAFERISMLIDGDLRLYQLGRMDVPLPIPPLGFNGTDLAWMEWAGPHDGPWRMPMAAVLGGAERKLGIVKFPEDNIPTLATFPLPEFVKETTRMVHGGFPASFFMLTDGQVRRLIINQQGQVQELPMQLPGVNQVDDLDIDDQGRLVIVAEGQTKAFRQNKNLGWDPDPEHVFANLQVGRRFLMPRSRSNWDPRQMIDPPNQAPDPMVSQLPSQRDCPGDLDVDRVVGGSDLGLMLAAWGEERSVADIDRNGLVDGADLGALLARWGQCVD
ncbi:MAG: hypothetical protein MK085_02540, partial [Phycisphaerales bacterium]|nr:hypothetical protein [Phycisphaerales bacterium]